MAKPAADDRREALCTWLRANGINPNDVPLHGDLYAEPGPDGTRHIHYEAFHRGEDGRRHVDERGQNIAVERRTTPLLVEPPDWWEPYRKPTRDQLLTVLARVRALADEEGEQNTYIERARLRAVLELAYEEEGL